MKRAWIVVVLAIMLEGLTTAQVAEMNWELDLEIYLKMANDSNYTFDIREVFHITDINRTDFTSEFVFYPVNPGDDFVNDVVARSAEGSNYKTLWSALNAKLGGGWIHFINCIAYALETHSLDLTEPIMKRPESNWKPDPVTETWARTRKWDYYIPVSQKNANKEFKLRVKNKEFGDLKNLPHSYIELFEGTSDKKYKQLEAAANSKEIAKIDLVKVMLGANYLGEEQINYLSNAVLNAVKSYSTTKLPSVLIFDEYEAAAAMSLNAEGYVLESVVFRSSAGLSVEERNSRKKEIIKILNTINSYNQEAFKKRLDTYYMN